MNNIDLLITADDLTLNSANITELVSERACIAQDLKHMIRETGLLVELIGSRDQGQIATNLKIIEIKVEEDLRIKPGTAKVTQVDIERFLVTATTIEYGHLEVSL